jgi:hypothetical protein
MIISESYQLELGVCVLHVTTSLPSDLISAIVITHTYTHTNTHTSAHAHTRTHKHTYTRVAQAPKVVMGPGTGLGAAQLMWDDGRQSYKVWPGTGVGRPSD